jgi:hypothetical protein
MSAINNFDSYLSLRNTHKLRLALVSTKEVFGFFCLLTKETRTQAKRCETPLTLILVIIKEQHIASAIDKKQTYVGAQSMTTLIRKPTNKSPLQPSILMSNPSCLYPILRIQLVAS